MTDPQQQVANFSFPALHLSHVTSRENNQFVFTVWLALTKWRGRKKSHSQQKRQPPSLPTPTTLPPPPPPPPTTMSVSVRADYSLEELVVPEIWVGDADARVTSLSSSATGHKKANRILTPPGRRRNPAEDHSWLIDDRWSTDNIYIYMSSSEKVPLKKVSMIQLGVGWEGGVLFTKMLFSSSDNESRNWFSGFGRFEARLHNKTGVYRKKADLHDA